MNFGVLREKGGHWPVRRVGYEPELGFCYPEFSVSCQCAYSSPLIYKTKQLGCSQHQPRVWKGDPDCFRNKLGKASFLFVVFTLP